MNFSLLLFQPLIPLECNFIYIISLMHQDSYSFIAFSEKSNFKQAVLHQAKDFLPHYPPPPPTTPAPPSRIDILRDISYLSLRL